MGRWFRSLIALAGLLGLASPQGAIAQNLSHALPASATVGTTTPVACYGGGLGAARTLWTSFPAKVDRTAAPAPADNQATFNVTVPADVPAGVHGLRVVTETGITELRLIVIDDLPVVVEAPSHASIDQAQKVPLPISVDGIALPEQSDFYAITVAAGQRVAFEVVGNRLGTDFDPLLVIHNQKRQQIVSHDNDEGLGFDLRFEHEFKEAGEYFVEVRDTRYQGGGNWVYHLRMGDFPIARVAFPAGGKRGQVVSVAFPGRSATDLAPMFTAVPANSLDSLLTISAKGTNGSTWVPFVVDPKDQQLELEPNDLREHANAFEVGRTLNGRLQVPKDIDCFRFTAKKDQVVTFVADTRRLSSPTDLLLRIVNQQGGEVAQADDAGTQDAKLDFKPPADGAYTLLVEDLLRRGGPEFTYRIETGSAAPSIALQPSVERIVIAQGSAVPLMLTANRVGLGGQIDLEVQSAAPGLQCKSYNIPSGSGAAAVAIHAAVDAPLGLQSIRILGTTKAGEQTFHGTTNLAPLLAPALANLQLMPPSVAQDIPVLVRPRPFFTLAAKLDAKAIGRFTNGTATIRASKEKFFDEAITLAVQNLPPNVALTPKPIEKGKDSVQVVFESKANTPLGRFPVFVSGSATQRDRSTQVFADIFYVDIAPAYALAIEPKELNIVRDGKVKLTVKAERLPGYDGPIDVTLANVPAGVTAPPAKIADKQNETVVELSAAKDAAVAKVENLIATGKATVGGQAETVNSPAVKLAVAEK